MKLRNGKTTGYHQRSKMDFSKMLRPNISQPFVFAKSTEHKLKEAEEKIRYHETTIRFLESEIEEWKKENEDLKKRI